jgi:hypothetical protein
MEGWRFEYHSQIRIHENKDVDITIIRDDKNPEAVIIIKTRYQLQGGYSIEQMTLTEDEFFQLVDIIKPLLERVEELAPDIKPV